MLDDPYEIIKRLEAERDAAIRDIEKEHAKYVYASDCLAAAIRERDDLSAQLDLTIQAMGDTALQYRRERDEARTALQRIAAMCPDEEDLAHGDGGYEAGQIARSVLASQPAETEEP